MSRFKTKIPLMEEENNTFKELEDLSCLSPKVIVKKLNKHIIGQDSAKRILAVTIFNHIKRITQFIKGEPMIEKSNLLILGPTGSGKTHLIETICKEMQIPLGICDATEFTETGYYGGDVEECLAGLYDSAGGDITMTERGIVYIDEFDKIAETDNISGKRNITGKGVQRSLLKIMEGKTVKLCTKEGANRSVSTYVDINTKNILFIVGGAFADLSKQIAAKQGGRAIGFHATHKHDDELLQEVTSEDLISYGFMPEIVGRLPNIAVLNSLTEADLVDILTKPENSIIEQYKNLFAMDFCRLSISEEALLTIAAFALKQKTGARGLRTIMEKCLIDLMFNAPESILMDIELTPEMIESKLGKF